MASAQPKTFTIRLVCESMAETPSEEGPLDVGIQDKAQVVHTGQVHSDGSVSFGCTVEARLDTSTGRPLYRGTMVHGTPEARFLYLSWKRKVRAIALWYWRVKIPLVGITWKQVSGLQSNEVLETDITGRRPHATEAIVWRVRGASEA